MITKLRFERFTAFEKLTIGLSPGINIFAGANGTGKTHILKTLYAASEITNSKTSFPAKLEKVFLPYRNRIGRLVKRCGGSAKSMIEVTRQPDPNKAEIKLQLTMSNHTKAPEDAKVIGANRRWHSESMNSVYIPVKEMLSNAPGFRSLYGLRNIHFEEIYDDILLRAFLDPLRGPADKDRKQLLKILQQAMNGKVIRENEEFFLSNNREKLEFTLVAEGLRKLGLLWLLIQNGTLTRGAVLCWDEPEANLNPKLMKTVVNILLALHRMGVQVFLATHDYVLLKYFHLLAKEGDAVMYHNLQLEDGMVTVANTPDYMEMRPSVIDDTFADLIDLEIKRSMGDLGQ